PGGSGSVAAIGRLSPRVDTQRRHVLAPRGEPRGVVLVLECLEPVPGGGVPLRPERPGLWTGLSAGYPNHTVAVRRRPGGDHLAGRPGSHVTPGNGWATRWGGRPRPERAGERIRWSRVVAPLHVGAAAGSSNCR